MDFEEIYLQYAPLVERFAYSLLKNDLAVKDVSQTVFLKLYQMRDRIPDIQSIKSYLFKATRNAVIDYVSDYGEIYSEEIKGEIEDVAGMISEEDRVEKRDLIMLIHLAEDKMPEQRRKVFRMSRVEGMKYQEIADRLGISVKTVEYHISKALRDLKNVIQVYLLFFT